MGKAEDLDKVAEAVKPMIRAMSSIHTTPIFGHLWPYVVLAAVYSAVVWLLDRYWLHPYTASLVQPNFQSTLALSVSILLVFRTNTSYDRWWEGRKLWGQLVNDCRTLAIKTASMVRSDPQGKGYFIHLLMSFALGLQHHLRDGISLRRLPGFEDDAEDPKHVPAHLVQRMYEQAQLWKTKGMLDPTDAWMMDRHLANLLDLCGGCERIRKTPIALSYLRYVRQALTVYLLILPWGLVHQVQFGVVPTSILVAYFMFGLEIIAEHQENPFGYDEDDLDLEAINAGIHATLAEILSHMEHYSEIPENLPAKKLFQ